MVKVVTVIKVIAMKNLRGRNKRIESNSITFISILENILSTILFLRRLNKEIILYLYDSYLLIDLII